MSESYDLLLKGGRVIDPASGIDGRHDVAVKDGRIARIAPNILDGAATKVESVAGHIVIPGMIDTHAHVYEGVTGRFGLNPDMVGVQSGVTTLVDQGGASCMTFPGFRRFISEPSASRVYAFISAYVVGGLEGHYYPDLYGPNGVDVDATVRAAVQNRDLVKGVKAHAEIGGFARWGIEVMRMAQQIGHMAELPVYIHFGQLWPLPETGDQGVDADDILPQIAELMGPGDILAHPFTRHPGGFVDKKGKLHPVVKEALSRGMKVDVGHGSHFSFNMARRVLEAGVMPDTLGADMHGYNTKVPPAPGTPKSHPDPENHPFASNSQFSLVRAMVELMALGVPLEDVVPMVTSSAAAMLGLSGELGTLKVGTPADISVLSDERGRWPLVDGEGTRVMADRMLQPLFCLRAGVRFEANAPILPEVLAA